VGGGALTPGARSEAHQARVELDHLAARSTRVVRTGDRLAFFNGERLLGTFATRESRSQTMDATVRSRVGVLTVGSGAGASKRVFRLVETRRGPRGGEVREEVRSVIHHPGAPRRQTRELFSDGKTEGEHAVKAGRDRSGKPAYLTVERYTGTQGRQITVGPGYRSFGLEGPAAATDALTLPVDR